MDYQELYKAKHTTAEALAAQVQNGWLIGMDAGASQTPTIISALAARARNNEIAGVRVQTLLDVYPLEYLADNSLFGSITEVASGDPNYSATEKHYTAEIKLIRHLQNLDTALLT